MKKIALMLIVLLAAYAVFAVEATLNDGRMFKGDLLSAQENRVILQDSGVVIQIPAEQINAIIDNGKDVTAEIIAKAMMGQGTDIHFIEEDDFFVTEIALEGNPSVPVKTAKMINPPTQSTKMQAQFILTGDGSQLWTKNYYATKIAKIKDLKVGTIVIIFEAKGEEGIMRGPKNEDEKRTGNWIMTKIVNLDDVTSGFVTITGDTRVSMDDLRIITK